MRLAEESKTEDNIWTWDLETPCECVKVGRDGRKCGTCDACGGEALEFAELIEIVRHHLHQALVNLDCRNSRRCRIGSRLIFWDEDQFLEITAMWGQHFLAHSFHSNSLLMFGTPSPKGSPYWEMITQLLHSALDSISMQGYATILPQQQEILGGCSNAYLASSTDLRTRNVLVRPQEIFHRLQYVFWGSVSEHQLT